MRIEAGKTYRDAEGNKVGPMTMCEATMEHPWSWDRTDGMDQIYRHDGTSRHNPSLVAEWTEGPVRTVTRSEIVRGRYGRLDVGYVVNVPDCDRPDEPPRVEVEIELTGGCGFTADELDEISRHTATLAEALRAQ